MRNTETGEFELVVGNKQLLSAFFIIVLLCAVAFVMGYVLGENSRSTKASPEMANASPAVPLTGGESRPQPASPVTPPAQTPAQPQTEAPAAAAPATESRPEPTTQPSRELQPPAEKSGPQAAASGPGSFWQVTATSNQASAQDLLQTLRDKGFPAQLKPGKDNLIRVLVGPYNDKASFAKAKVDIENGGFGTPVIAR